jgi:hypothetical protein
VVFFFANPAYNSLMTIFGVKILNSLLRIRGLLDQKFGIRDGNIRIRDKHPGSATLTLLHPDPQNARVNNHTYLVPIIPRTKIHVTLI